MQAVNQVSTQHSIRSRSLNPWLTASFALFLSRNCILNTFHSGFRSGHSAVTAAFQVIIDIVSAIDHG